MHHPFAHLSDSLKCCPPSPPPWEFQRETRRKKTSDEYPIDRTKLPELLRCIYRGGVYPQRRVLRKQHDTSGAPPAEG